MNPDKERTKKIVGGGILLALAGVVVYFNLNPDAKQLDTNLLGTASPREVDPTQLPTDSEWLGILSTTVAPGMLFATEEAIDNCTDILPGEGSSNAWLRRFGVPGTYYLESEGIELESGQIVSLEDFRTWNNNVLEGSQFCLKTTNSVPSLDPTRIPKPLPVVPNVDNNSSGNLNLTESNQPITSSDEALEIDESINHNQDVLWLNLDGESEQAKQVMNLFNELSINKEASTTLIIDGNPQSYLAVEAMSFELENLNNLQSSRYINSDPNNPLFEGKSYSWQEIEALLKLYARQQSLSIVSSDLKINGVIRGEVVVLLKHN